MKQEQLYSDTQQYNPPLFGLNIDPSAKNLQLAYSLAVLADSAKLDFISIQDHPYNGNFFDTWTLLTFLGARTQHVRLLTNVVNMPLRPPAMLAKAAAWRVSVVINHSIRFRSTQK